MIGHLLWGLFAVAAIGGALLLGKGVLEEHAARTCDGDCDPPCRVWAGTVTGAMVASTIARDDSASAANQAAISASRTILAAAQAAPTRKRSGRAR